MRIVFMVSPCQARGDIPLAIAITLDFRGSQRRGKKKSVQFFLLLPVCAARTTLATGKFFPNHLLEGRS
jgi:hypothetical protein